MVGILEMKNNGFLCGFQYIIITAIIINFFISQIYQLDARSKPSEIFVDNLAYEI